MPMAYLSVLGVWNEPWLLLAKIKKRMIRAATFLMISRPPIISLCRNEAANDSKREYEVNQA